MVHISTLIHLQLRADDDNRTAGVVNTLAQQVLAETALLALEQVRQALQGTVVGAGDRAAAAAVVDQAVNCSLQHPLLVAHNDVGSTQLQQAAQTVVAVDDAAVQVIQVGGAARFSAGERCKGRSVRQSVVWNDAAVFGAGDVR